MTQEKAPMPQEPQGSEVSEGKFFALMGYISVLCLVPLLLKRGNKFAMFHGRQGLVLFILELAAGVLKVVPAVGEVVFTLAFVVCGILSLVGILKVLMNEYWEMPLVYDKAHKISH